GRRARRAPRRARRRARIDQSGACRGEGMGLSQFRRAGRGGIMTREIASGKHLKSALLGVAVAIAVPAGPPGFWIGTGEWMPGVAPTAVSAETAKTDASGRRILYWHDPMAPGQKFDKPGKSPFMCMGPLPVYAGTAADRGTVTIDPRFAQSFAVRTVEAKEGSLESGFTAVGTVAADERGIVAVQARRRGYIERLRVRAQYDGVARGQPLADLYVPEWLAAEEELLALRASAQPGATQLAAAA